MAGRASAALKALRKLAQGWSAATTRGNRPTKILLPLLAERGEGRGEELKLNQRASDSANAGFWIPRQRTFPNPNHPPAVAAQCPRYPHVTLLVSRKFPPPERSVGFGFGGVSRTAVPETAVHKNREP